MIAVRFSVRAIVWGGIHAGCPSVYRASSQPSLEARLEPARPPAPDVDEGRSSAEFGKPATSLASSSAHDFIEHRREALRIPEGADEPEGAARRGELASRPCQADGLRHDPGSR